MKRPALAIVIQNVSTSGFVPPSREIRRWLRKALPNEVHGELTVRIVDEAEGAELNGRYRGKQGATNVLAFPAEPGAAALAGEPPVVGDLLICAPILEREAEAQRKPLTAHWAHVLIHGALHLVGYDHETSSAAEVMQAREREVLAAFGYADPYAAVP